MAAQLALDPAVSAHIAAINSFDVDATWTLLQTMRW